MKLLSSYILMKILIIKNVIKIAGYILLKSNRLFSDKASILKNEAGLLLISHAFLHKCLLI